MSRLERLFLEILSEVLHEYKSVPSRAAKVLMKSEHPADTVMALLKISRSQKVVPLLYDFLCTHEIEIPKDSLPSLHQEISGYALNYYQNAYFTEFICHILDNAHLPYALMKGTILSELYPKPEFRRFGDVDIFINQKEAFQKACVLLERNGLKRVPSNGDHHYEYVIKKQSRTYLVELHQNLISSQENQKLNIQVKTLYHSLPLDGVLPVTYDAIYLLLHMLQHMLDAGFGIKLLCDWVLYLEKKTEEINTVLLKKQLERLGIFSFAEQITCFCIQYLGLQKYPGCFHYDVSSTKRKQALHILAEDIFTGGEYGKNDSSRMIIMKGNFRLNDYFQELHRQTKKNFPKLWKTILPLPILWCLTGLRFLKNNKTIRSTDTKKILATTKKRQNLLRYMEIKL